MFFVVLHFFVKMLLTHGYLNFLLAFTQCHSNKVTKDKLLEMSLVYIIFLSCCTPCPEKELNVPFSIQEIKSVKALSLRLLCPSFGMESV